MNLQGSFHIAAVIASTVLSVAASVAAQSGTYIETMPYALQPSRHPNSIAVGADGALWFTETGANRIGRITTDGAVTEYVLPGGNRLPYWITAGPDGDLWFTYGYGNKAIGRITTAGAITVYSVPDEAVGITAGPDGALWFTENYGNKVGRMTTAGVVTAEYIVPTANVAPNQITTGPKVRFPVKQRDNRRKIPACDS